MKDSLTGLVSFFSPTRKSHANISFPFRWFSIFSRYLFARTVDKTKTNRRSRWKNATRNHKYSWGDSTIPFLVAAVLLFFVVLLLSAPSSPMVVVRNSHGACFALTISCLKTSDDISNGTRFSFRKVNGEEMICHFRIGIWIDDFFREYKSGVDHRFRLWLLPREFMWGPPKKFKFSGHNSSKPKLELNHLQPTQTKSLSSPLPSLWRQCCPL